MMKIRLTLLISSFILIMLLSCPSSAANSSLNYTITYSIKVDDSGTAFWTIEKWAFLESDMDIAIFHQDASPLKFTEFERNITSMVLTASERTGRNMSINFESGECSVLYTSSGCIGVIIYRFDWIGFAKKVSTNRFEIGDVFDGKFIDLEDDDKLIIEFQENCKVIECSVKPDELNSSDKTNSTLVWFGPHDFDEEEPKLSFEVVSSSGINESFIMTALGISAVITAFCGFFIYTRRKRTVSLQIGPLEMEDEHKVIDVLKDAGGIIKQSVLTEKTGFSKAKISRILSSLEKKGLIRREKRGNRKVVFLKK